MKAAAPSPATPADLKKALGGNPEALGGNPEARAAWEKFPPSHKREYLGYIDEARKAETRARRIEKTVAFIAAQRRSK